MSYPSQFSEWLSLSSRDGRGGMSAEPPAIQRGRKLTMRLSLPVDPVFGDWTAGTFAARLRAAPDASGAALAAYTPTVGTPAGGLTNVDFELAGSASSTLPADSDGDGITEVFLEITYTVASNETALVSTRQLVSGVI